MRHKKNTMTFDNMQKLVIHYITQNSHLLKTLF